MKEYQDVLNREKFGFDKQIIKELLQIIKTKGIKFDPYIIDK